MWQVRAAASMAYEPVLCDDCQEQGGRCLCVCACNVCMLMCVRRVRACICVYPGSVSHMPSGWTCAEGRVHVCDAQRALHHTSYAGDPTTTHGPPEPVVPV